MLNQKQQAQICCSLAECILNFAVDFLMAGTAEFMKEEIALINMVARDRIELPTRGFSILCSTD